MENINVLLQAIWEHKERLRHVRIEAYKAGAWKEKAIHFSS